MDKRSHYHFSQITDVTDVTLGANGIWLETRTGAGGTVLVAPHGSMDKRTHYHPYHKKEVTDVTLGANGIWLGTRAGAGGTPTLA